MTTIHAGDHTTDCETCRLQCDCQDCRIKRNASGIDWSDPDLDFDKVMEYFEDRDPTEFI